MRRGTFLVVVAATGSSLTVAGGARALERASVRAPDRADDWSAAATCVVRYYNNCTGWVWVWGGWSPGEQMGTVVHGCCSQAVLTLTSHLTFSGVASGWGFTGTIGVYSADADDCPTGPPLAERPWLPPRQSGWYSQAWDVSVPRDFVLKVVWGSPTGFTNPAGASFDHPAAGATGPQACGVCFPSSRTVRSFHYGFEDTPYCPGHALNDGVCDVESMLELQFSCPVHVEERSWGKLKALYR